MSLTISAYGYVDVARGETVEPAFVTIDGGVITRVARTDDPAAHAVEDLSDCWLLPGLIDAHVHLAFNSSASDVLHAVRTLSDGDLQAMMFRHAERALRAGVTTIRDLGDRGYLAMGLATLGNSPLPNILCAGPPLTSLGGHCHFLGGEVRSKAEALALVREHAARGVDVIKVMVTGGILTTESRLDALQFDVDELAAITKLAHSLQLPVAAHAHSRGGVEAGVAAGVDTVEHCTFATDQEYEEHRSAVTLLARPSAPIVCPTYVAREGVDWDPQRFAWRSAVLRTLDRAGVRLALSTDAGVMPGLHHDSAPWALVAMVRAGLSVPAAVAAATLYAAEACGLQARKGLLAEGADADIVAVPANPLDHVEAVLEAKAVFVGGKRAF